MITSIEQLVAVLLALGSHDFDYAYTKYKSVYDRDSEYPSGVTFFEVYVNNGRYATALMELLNPQLGARMEMQKDAFDSEFFVIQIWTGLLKTEPKKSKIEWHDDQPVVASK